MSELTKRLRDIPFNLRTVVPVHYSATFTKPEHAPTMNTLDAGIAAHEAADRIDALEECLRYYAEPKNWARPVTYVTNGDVTHKTRGLCEMDCDKGNKARALLGEK